MLFHHIQEPEISTCSHRGKEEGCVFLCICICSLCVCVGVRGVEKERGVKMGGKEKGVKKRWGWGVAWVSPRRSASQCQSAFRLRGVGPKATGVPKNKLRGRRYARTHTRRTQRETHTPADGGAEPKKRHSSVKRKGYHFTLLFFLLSLAPQWSRKPEDRCTYWYGFIHLSIYWFPSN